MIVMAATTFDLDVLRSFVTGVELGSFAKAADRLGRSTSAVSAQLRKLEDQAGTAIVRKSGRGLALTDAGETMLAYARRLLELNDEAAAAIRGIELEGWVRLGLQEDFDGLLPEVLGRFARAHPKVRIEARVARNAELIDRLHAGRLDLALAWDGGATLPYGERIAELPMRWIARAGDRWERRPSDLLPLVAFEAPCLFRTAATAALDRAGIAWRLAFTSPNLGGLWAATAAGLGVSIRTSFGVPAGVRALAPEETALPALPTIGLGLYLADAEPTPVANRLGEIVVQAVRESIPARARTPA
jgi:DNA-binding transcriptional LysR family regulator